MIPLATVKTFLGIADTTYDAAITAMIPIAEAKYREIANCQFNWMMYASFKAGEDTMSIGGIDTAVQYGDAFLSTTPASDSQLWQLSYGDIIEGSGIAAGTYITAIDTLENEITVSENFIADGTRIRVTTNISYYPVMSSLVWYMVGQQSTTAQDAKEYKSRSVGPLSVSLDNGELNKKFGVPQKIVNAIPKYAGMY